MQREGVGVEDKNRRGETMDEIRQDDLLYTGIVYPSRSIANSGVGAVLPSWQQRQ